MILLRPLQPEINLQMKNIISLILIVLSIGLVFVYIMPEYNKISNLRTEKSDYENTLAKSKDLKVLRDSLLTKYNAILPEDKDKLQKVIPSKFDPIKLIVDINVIAAKYGMGISGVNVQSDNSANSQNRADIVAPTQSNIYNTTTISFNTSGQYSAFLSFLKDLENSVELLDIRNLSINQSGQTNSNVLNFKITIQTYYMK